VRVELLGVRGSTAAPGHEFAEVGGHTSCVAIHPDGSDGRLLVLDAGTGFRQLATVLGETPLRADIVLTHLHWDHVQGLPFLPNADRPDAEIDLWIPAAGSDAEALELLESGFSPPHFPITPGELRGDWRFHALAAGSRSLVGTAVSTAEVAHKGGMTLGVRVANGDTAIAYLPDHCPRRATTTERAAAVDLATGVDVLLHGGQFLEAERATANAFGHGTAADAVDLAHEAGARHLVLVHHSPTRTDHAVPEVLREAEKRSADLGADLEITVGIEGLVLDI